MGVKGWCRPPSSGVLISQKCHHLIENMKITSHCLVLVYKCACIGFACSASSRSLGWFSVEFKKNGRCPDGIYSLDSSQIHHISTTYAYCVVLSCYQQHGRASSLLIWPKYTDCWSMCYKSGGDALVQLEAITAHTVAMVMGAYFI